MSLLKFRKTALEKVTSPDQLTDLIQIVTPKNWIFLYTIGMLLIALLIWGVFGKIPTRVSGEGIILAEDGTIYDAIALANDAHVVAIKVKPGDRISKNDPIAYLDSPDLAKQVAIQENYVKELSNNYVNLTHKSQDEIDKRKKDNEKTQHNLEQDLKSQNENLAITADLIQRKQQLVKRAIISREDIASTYNTFYAIKQRIHDVNNQLIQNKISLETFTQDWDTKLRDLNLRMIDAKRELAKLNEGLTISKIVVSPISGVVTAIRVSMGDAVKAGTPIVSIADEKKGLDALVYLPAQDGQRVRTNSKALVSPLTIEKEEFGSIMGKVFDVSKFPSSPESIAASLHNENLVKHFTKDNATIAIRIHLNADSHTFSGYQWTTEMGPTKYLTPGMIVKAEITVREQSPISLIIPQFKRLLKNE